MQFHADMALDEAEPGVKAVRVGAARRRSELDQLAIARAALVDRPQDHPFAEALNAQVADDAHRLDQPAPASDEGSARQKAELHRADAEAAQLGRDTDMVGAGPDWLERRQVRSEERQAKKRSE